MCLEGRPHGQGDGALKPRAPERGIHRPGPSATEPDWTREHKSFWAWDPSRSLLASLRSYQRHAGSRHPWDVSSARSPCFVIASGASSRAPTFR